MPLTPLLGDVVIALETASAEAAREGKPLADHLSHLVVHGMLHLLGHDHQLAAEADEMEALEVAVLGCPCMAISGWLRKKHDPNYEPRWSVTVWLYQKYGAPAGIAVFVFFFLAALGVRALIV